MSAGSPQEQHLKEMLENRRHWERKPVLQQIYKDFYDMIAASLTRSVQGPVVELGSGLGHFKDVCPDCICTDIFPNPWIDQVENAYRLSFPDGTVSNLVLFDVFHHLKYPGTALREFARVLAPGGRLIVFDPGMSLLGLIVFGLFHHEPVAVTKPITWMAPADFDPEQAGYYAAQGNATRVFAGRRYAGELADWRMLTCRRLSALAYAASGGYRGPQLYPDAWLPALQRLDRLLEHLPVLFSTRLLVVLERGRAP